VKVEKKRWGHAKEGPVPWKAIFASKQANEDEKESNGQNGFCIG